MNKQVITAIAVIAVALAAVVAIIVTTGEKVPEQVNLAVVNNATIPIDDFTTRVSAYEREYGPSFPAAERQGRIDDFKKATLDQIVDAELTRQLVQEAGFSLSTAERDKLIADAKAAWGDDDAYLAALEAQGLTEESYRAELERQTLLQRYAESLPVEVTATEEDLERIHAADRARFPGTFAGERGRIVSMLELGARGELLRERIDEKRAASKIVILVPELAEMYE